MLADVSTPNGQTAPQGPNSPGGECPQQIEAALSAELRAEMSERHFQSRSGTLSQIRRRPVLLNVLHCH